MDNHQSQEIACKHCHTIFTSKEKCDYHVCLMHKNEVNAHHLNGNEVLIHRSESGKFICICNNG